MSYKHFLCLEFLKVYTVPVNNTTYCWCEIWIYWEILKSFKWRYVISSVMWQNIAFELTKGPELVHIALRVASKLFRCEFKSHQELWILLTTLLFFIDSTIFDGVKREHFTIHSDLLQNNYFNCRSSYSKNTFPYLLKKVTLMLFL